MAYKILTNISRGVSRGYRYVILGGKKFIEKDEVDRLRDLVLDAQTMMIHAKSFEVNDSQKELYESFKIDAARLRMERDGI
jgi:hypothetical protein